MPLIICLTLAACGPDETLTGYADPTLNYHLTELDGRPFAATATLRTDEPGSIYGDAPCNSYRATQTVPYPWFTVGPIAATRRACPDLDAETEFFAALSDMQFAEAAGPVLILNNDAGRSMVFQGE